MPEFSTYIDIDPSEYVDECSKSEIKELIDELVIHGYINQSDSLIDKEKISLMEQEFHEKLDKLKSKYYNLSPEERKAKGLRGREWVTSDESGMSARVMCKNLIESMEEGFNKFIPRTPFDIIKVEDRKQETVPHKIIGY